MLKKEKKRKENIPEDERFMTGGSQEKKLWHYREWLRNELIS